MTAEREMQGSRRFLEIELGKVTEADLETRLRYSAERLSFEPAWDPNLLRDAWEEVGRLRFVLHASGLGWMALDRANWPEIQSVDFGGVDSDGNPLMLRVCPGCGTYSGNDEVPEDHFDDVNDNGPCPWKTSRMEGQR